MKDVRGRVLNEAIAYAISVLEDDLRGREKEAWVVFGASGFIGKWICLLGQSIKRMGILDIKVVGASREPSRAANQLKEFFPENIPIPEMIKNVDLVRNPSDFSCLTDATTVFYAATSTSNTSIQPLRDSNSFVNQIFESLKRANRPRFLNLSSGAVYSLGKGQRIGLKEDSPLRKRSQPISDYQAIKLDLEDLVQEATRAEVIHGVNARLFAFLGPGFPVDAHFAVSNLVNAALQNDELRLMGNPKTIRSYMTPQDLVIWLSQLWLHGDELQGEEVNIGSDQPVTMLELAESMKHVFEVKKEIKLLNPLADASCYYPCTERFRSRLTVPPIVPLEEALRQWRSFLLNS